MRRILIAIAVFIEVAIILFILTASTYLKIIPGRNTVREAAGDTKSTQEVLTTATSAVVTTATSAVVTTATPIVTTTAAPVMTTTGTQAAATTAAQAVTTATASASARPPKVVPPPTTSANTLPTSIINPAATSFKEDYNSSEPVIYPAKTFKADSKQIAITFDDGYNKKAIERVLEVCKTYNVKLTFFIVGAMLQEYPELWKQAAEDGHEICNHTYGHSDLDKLSHEEVMNQIKKWEIAAEKVLGLDYVNKMKSESPFIRMPFGSGSSNKKIMQIFSETGYIPVGWAVETCYAVLRHYDLTRADIEEVSAHVSRHITSTVKSGRIILLHFNSYDTLKLDEIFQQIIDQGYEIVTLSEVF